MFSSLMRQASRRPVAEDPKEAGYSFQQRGMSIALAATYFTVMGAKCALPAVLSLVTSPSTGLTFPNGREPQQLFSRLLTLSTLAIAAGKLLLGPVIDRCGGVFSLQVALSLLALLMGLISTSQSFQVFAVAWIFVDFIFSSCWAACINAIHQSFPQHLWPAQIGTLASAARTGNAAAFALFAWILHVFQPRMRQTWRPVFAIAAVSQIVPVLLLSYFRPPPPQQHQQQRRKDVPKTTLSSPLRKPNNVTEEAKDAEEEVSIGSSLSILRREICTLDFWLHLVNRSVLMVFASFLLFVPTLLMQVYHTTSSAASQVASIYALGCLLSLTLGSQSYAKLSTRRSKLAALAVLLGGATVSSVGQLGHVAGWWELSATASTILLFVWGLSFAIPFYIPPSLYALTRGGKQSSATIADVFDIGGFGLLAGFNGYVASIEHANLAAWVPTFQMTTACALASYISLSLAAWRENQKE